MFFTVRSVSFRFIKRTKSKWSTHERQNYRHICVWKKKEHFHIIFITHSRLNIWVRLIVHMVVVLMRSFSCAGITTNEQLGFFFLVCLNKIWFTLYLYKKNCWLTFITLLLITIGEDFVPYTIEPYTLMNTIAVLAIKFDIIRTRQLLSHRTENIVPRDSDSFDWYGDKQK